MMINLDNYEEYFLLYIDNELDEEQREAVAAFVQQHPHLAAELAMLQDTKLPLEDDVVFSDKSLLYKAADSNININNYQDYFLLHTDKELAADQEKEVEQFVLQHPQLQEEFLLWQRVKLVPEDIECADKQRLYKQPAKRVITLYITRIAVAAAITGILVLTGHLIVNNDKQQPVAVNTQQNQAVEKNTPLQKDSEVILPEKKSKDFKVGKNETKQVEKFPAKSTNVTSIASALPDKKQSKTEPLIPQIEPLQIKQLAPPAAPETIIVAGNIAPKHDPANVLKPLEEVDEKESAPTVMYVSDEYATAKPAVYKELNTDEDEQSQTLYVGSLQLNKAKVNGLFKKATHLLGSKAKEPNL